MKWIVGIDLRPRCIGALHFARWVVGAARGEEAEELVGVHVLEEDHLLAVLRFHHLDEVLAAARREIEASLRDEAVPQVFRDVQLVQGLRAPESLCDAAARLPADAILVGRAVPREGHAIVRLGRVARRLLRVATVPVVVVPPDMRGPDFEGDGPVIALTKLTDESLGTCRFAERMARQVGRKLVLVHVQEVAAGYAERYVAAETLARIGAERRPLAQEALGRWTASSGVSADALEIVEGNLVDRAIELAQERRAALIVVGSRHGSKLERLLVASRGGELAASATRPVAIVPPAHP